jgi:mono/diheme cytochrome c family protein
MPRRSSFAKIVTPIIIGLTISCGVSAAPEVLPDATGSIDSELIKGREIWGVHCSSCHGSSGQGGRGKRLNNGNLTTNFPDQVEIVSLIQNGKGQGMPAFSSKITVEETKAVIRYVMEVLN